MNIINRKLNSVKLETDGFKKCFVTVIAAKNTRQKNEVIGKILASKTQPQERKKSGFLSKPVSCQFRTLLKEESYVGQRTDL